MTPSRFSAEEVSRLTGLSPSRLTALVRAGLVGDRRARRACGCRLLQQELNFAGGHEVPEPIPLALPAKMHGAFSFRDIKVLRTVQALLARGLQLHRIERALVMLKRQAAARHLPLSGASLQHDGERLLASDGQTIWDVEDGGTVACICRPADTGAVDPTSMGRASRPIGAPEPEQLRRCGTSQTPELQPELLRLPFHHCHDEADQFFEEALKLEEQAPRRAFALYLRALACDPAHVEALINAGRLCSADQDIRRALSYFRLASLIDQAHPVAHFNLAVTLHGQGDVKAATEAYRLALMHDPHFADAHYNLATLLEQQGDSQEARRHFLAFRAALERGPSH